MRLKGAQKRTQKRIWAIGVALVSVASGVALVTAPAPVVGCYQCDYPCPGAFDLGGYCMTPTGSAPSSCLVDGVPVAQCEPGYCGPWTLSSGTTLTVPVGSLWSTLGPRNDLHWFVACLPPGAADASSGDGGEVEEADISPNASVDASAPFLSAIAGMAGTLTIFFDGVPAQGCVCTPDTEISCAQVPQTVQTLGFEYIAAPNPSDAGPDANLEDELEASVPTDGEVDAAPISISLAIAFDVGACTPSHMGCPQSHVPEGSAY